MKNHNHFFRSALFVLLLSAFVFSATPSFAAKSAYKVDKYGELYKYKGDSNVTIRTNTSAIDPDAFENVTTTRFSVANGNSYFKTIDGVLL